MLARARRGVDGVVGGDDGVGGPRVEHGRRGCHAGAAVGCEAQATARTASRARRGAAMWVRPGRAGRGCAAGRQLAAGARVDSRGGIYARQNDQYLEGHVRRRHVIIVTGAGPMEICLLTRLSKHVSIPGPLLVPRSMTCSSDMSFKMCGLLRLRASCRPPRPSLARCRPRPARLRGHYASQRRRREARTRRSRRRRHLRRRARRARARRRALRRRAGDRTQAASSTVASHDPRPTPPPARPESTRAMAEHAGSARSTRPNVRPGRSSRPGRPCPDRRGGRVALGCATSC